MTSFSLDPRDDLPLYAQLARQLREAVTAGRWPAGRPLPSVRTLVGLLKVNPQTVLRAYRELEEEGLVEPRQGQGTFVRTEAVEAAAEARRRELLEDIERLARQARDLGVPEEVIVQAVRKEKGES
ncbi:MAG: GntR family transcriptional regulator [Acidobacteria bacterium]|nr:GntR family transcriptional regulator [Acidobacteriota bacterium]